MKRSTESAFRKHLTINSESVFTRKLFLDVVGILLAMLLAAWLGNYIAELATRQVENYVARFIAGITIGVVVGICVGILVKYTWEKFLLLFLKHSQDKPVTK